MTAPLRCVVLDIDDTLYLERDYARSGFAACGEHLALPQFGEAAWAAFEEGARGTIFNVALQRVGLEVTGDRIRELVRVYREHRPAITMLEDARSCVAVWREAGLRLAVISDGPLASQSAKAEALGLPAICDPLVLTSALGEGFGKPHPLPYETVEWVTGVPGPLCLYVADNPKKDFVSPRARGWATLRVRRAGSLHEAIDSGDDVEWEVTDLRAAPPELAARLPWPSC